MKCIKSCTSNLRHGFAGGESCAIFGRTFENRRSGRSEWQGSGVFVMPGTLFERPGDFRISLTANRDMIERALPTFREAAG